MKIIKQTPTPPTKSGSTEGLVLPVIKHTPPPLPPKKK